MKRIIVFVFALLLVSSSAFSQCGGDCGSCGEVGKGEASAIDNVQVDPIIDLFAGKQVVRKTAAEDCWKFADGKVTIDLHKTTEFNNPAQVLRFESSDLGRCVLVTKSDDGEYHALRNHCALKAKLALVSPDGGELPCCGAGELVGEHDDSEITVPEVKLLNVTQDGDMLTVVVK